LPSRYDSAAERWRNFRSRGAAARAATRTRRAIRTTRVDSGRGQRAPSVFGGCSRERRAPRSCPRNQMLVAHLPADGDGRALADRIGLRARDTDADAVTSGVADDEHTVAVVDDHANFDRQAVRKRRAVADQLKTLGAQEHVGGRAREVLARVGIRLDRPEAVELDAPRCGRVDSTGEEVAVADE